MDQTGRPCPTGPIVPPHVITAIRRRINPKLGPHSNIGAVRVGSVFKCVLLRMPAEPHLMDQTSELIDTPHCGLHQILSLIAAGEWAPYLKGKAAHTTLIWVSGDLQRRSMQLPPNHLPFSVLSGGLGEIPIDLGGNSTPAALPNSRQGPVSHRVSRTHNHRPQRLDVHRDSRGLAGDSPTASRWRSEDAAFARGACRFRG